MNQKIIMIGDSITAGFNEKNLLSGFNIINKGINGDYSAGVLQRIGKDVIDLKPKKVFLLIGTNDLAFGRSNDDIVFNIAEILMMLDEKLDKSSVYVTSILPTRNVSDRPNERINNINDRLNKWAEKLNYFYLDLHSEMKDENGDLKNNYTVDGLHLNEEAYKKWTEILKNILNKK